MKPLFRENLFLVLVLSIFVLPASSNYRFEEFVIGPAGNDNMQSTNYSANESVDSSASDLQSGASFELGTGLEFLYLANVPPAPQLVNDGNYYNKLKIIINEGGNPSDTKYAVAISSDNWVTTEYVQSDFTVGSVLGTEDWQSYTDWGGAAGEYIVGLQDNTTYNVKVKAQQGAFTESRWGPEASASTSSPSLFFDIDVSTIDEETSPPYSIDFGQINIGSVNEASSRIWIDLETNGEGGGFVYIYSDGTGLTSSSKGSTIPSVTSDLSTVSKGFGAQVVSTTQTSGGPLIALSPYNGTGDNVGAVGSSVSTILSSSSAPVTGGRAAVAIKLKVNSLTPAASDYSAVFTVIASATF